MLKSSMGLYGFREYLPDFKSKWNPDSGPIINGVGIAATGLGLNAASTVGDKETFNKINNSLNKFYKIGINIEYLFGPSKLTSIGTDLLSSSIWLNAETKIKWYP